MKMVVMSVGQDLRDGVWGLGSFRLYSNWATWRLILGFPGYVLEFALNNWNRSLGYSKAYNSIPLLECTIVTIGW